MTYPDDFSDQRLAGQVMSYEVKIQGVKKKNMPELNDDFAKELGEFATVDAQINYLGSRLVDSRDFSLATFDSVVTFAPRPFGGFRNRPLIAPSRPFRQTRPFFQSGFPLLSPFVFPSQSFYSRDEYEREQLNSSLDSLLVRRAGLEAQWRELENQARLARVPQVWLLP